MLHKAIILDLDDTIFPTRSMDKEIFEPFFKDLSHKLSSYFKPDKIQEIFNDLWSRPIDFVIKKHNIPMQNILSSFRILENINLHLDLTPYSDYRYLIDNSTTRFLVTNGFQKLQLAKIKALGIQNDFKEIIINDPIKDYKSKRDIFRDIITHYMLNPNETIVIGDNPESEIDAGNKLDIITIQILREGVIKGDNAKYYINSFYDLSTIIN